MINFRQIVHLVALAKYGSYVRAANAVHLTQPALTRSIQALENQYGLKLFDRSRTGVFPTMVGRQIIAHAEELLLKAEAFEHELAGHNQAEVGEVSFGINSALASRYLCGTLSSIMHRKPALKMKTVIDGDDAMTILLLNDEIEFFFSLSETITPSSRLNIKPLLKKRSALFVRADHPLPVSGKLTAQMAATFPIIGGTIREELAHLNSADQSPAYCPSVACDNHDDILKDVVLRTDAIWATMELPNHEKHGLRKIDLHWLRIPDQVTIAKVTLPDRSLSPAAELIAAQFIQEIS